MYERFDVDASAGIIAQEKQWTYGGSISVGTYLFENWAVAARVGFGKETYLKLNGGNLNYTSDFIEYWR
ncbi:MAG: hypothetical protein R3A45_03135 [Bdellovibrionota bacterium]